MPNWVRNNVIFTGNLDTIKKIRNKVTTSESEFDFNAIIPAPKDLYNVESGSIEGQAIPVAELRKKLGDNWKQTPEFREYSRSVQENSPWFLSRFTWDELADKGDKYLHNKEKYGHTTWYTWCIENWGTKWNATDAVWKGPCEVQFDTAWSFPEGVFMSLADQYPDVNITAAFADEDLGNNCGIFEADESNITTSYIEEREFAKDVWGLTEEEEEE